MRFRDLKVSTKVMIRFAATMVLIVAMISPFQVAGSAGTA